MTSTDHLRDELIRLLIRATEEQSVSWQPTADEDAFRLNSKLGNIRISKPERFDQEMMDSYTVRNLSILNDRGRVVEEFAPEQGDETDFDKLFTLARRSAHNTDAILEGMINEFKTKVPEYCKEVPE